MLILSKLNVLSFLVLFISYLVRNVVAQAQECGRRANLEYTGLLEGVIASGGSSDDTLWCRYWATLCSYFHRTCPNAVSCRFEYDRQSPSCPSSYDLSSGGIYSDFSRCRTCNVKVEPSVAIPPRARVPKHTWSSRPTSTGTRSPTQSPPTSDVDPEYPGDASAEKRSISDVTSAVTLIMLALGLIGSFIALKVSSSSASSQFPSDETSNTEVIGGVPLATLYTSQPSGSSPSAIDPVTLLLHFQSISTSGFLSLSYPSIYRYFTFNFSWANLIVVSAGIKKAVNRMGLGDLCLYELYQLPPSNTEDSGLALVAGRYGVDRTVLGGVVFLGAVIGIACALALFVLVSLVLNVLSKTSKESSTIQSLAKNWPYMASNLSLRLFVWLLGTICTFAFYQFIQRCSSASLIALSAIEFSVLVLTLLFVSMLIVRTAKREGDPRALFPSESEQSQYSRKWGSLYSTLKPAVYWFFILDYQWVVIRSGIVAFGQGDGVVQVSLLVALEFIVFLVLLVKRPYRTKAASSLQLFLAGKRFVTTVLLLVFWDGFFVMPNIKRNIGIVLLSIESIIAISLFVALLVKGGAAFLEWNSKRKERRMSVTKAEFSE